MAWLIAALACQERHQSTRSVSDCKVSKVMVARNGWKFTWKGICSITSGKNRYDSRWHGTTYFISGSWGWLLLSLVSLETWKLPNVLGSNFATTIRWTGFAVTSKQWAAARFASTDLRRAQLNFVTASISWQSFGSEHLFPFHNYKSWTYPRWISGSRPAFFIYKSFA